MSAPGLFRTRKTLSVGDSGCFSKTILESDVDGFARVCGDFNPLHLDEEYARGTRFKHRIAHGILSAGVISTVLGTEIPGLGTIFRELHIRFDRPVYLGDTITARAIVTEVINPRRVCLMVACVNHAGEDVALGHAIVVPPKETTLVL